MAVPGSSPIVVIDCDTDQDSGFMASVESKLLYSLNKKLIKRCHNIDRTMRVL